MKKTTSRKSQGAVLTQVILEIFRLNGALLEAGDELTMPFGITSARWQVLGSVELEGRPINVAQIARRMGLSRQAVQRIANELSKSGHIEFKENPDHKRAKLVALTAMGQTTLQRLNVAQENWVNQLANNLDEKQLETTLTTLKKMFSPQTKQ